MEGVQWNAKKKKKSKIINPNRHKKNVKRAQNRGKNRKHNKIVDKINRIITLNLNGWNTLIKSEDWQNRLKQDKKTPFSCS